MVNIFNIMIMLLEKQVVSFGQGIPAHSPYCHCNFETP